MPDISFKEFMEKVEERLMTYPPETLRKILIEWAENTHPAKRREFLERLVPPPPKISEPDKELLDDIRDLAEMVENGDYCEGWGWDDEIHDERDWGDESWVYEVDEFFDMAHKALKAGHHKLSRDAYAELFDILKMGEEPGHLPGYDPERMIDTDLEDARACYLRAVYLSSPPDKRPSDLLEAMQRFRYRIGDNLNLKSIINVDTESLPDFDQFLARWIDLLKKTDKRSARYLLREAVMLSGGTPAIARLAREEGKRHPRAYVDWIKALEGKGDFRAMLRAAKEGLENVPKDYMIRAEIAEGLVRAGEHLGDVEAQLVGRHEAFLSNPSLSRLLSLFFTAEQRGCYGEEIDAAIARITSLLKKEYKDYSLTEDEETHEATASETLLNQAYLLAGRYEDAFNLCSNKGALGWSYGHNPKGLVIPFFLRLLSRGGDLYSPNLEHLWKWATDTACGGWGTQDVAERFQQAMEGVFQSLQLSADEEERYMQWCIEESGRRMDAIVGNKYRKSYHKAANLLMALAEVLANCGREADGTALIERYRRKYPRHRAFRQELDSAIERQDIYRV